MSSINRIKPVDKIAFYIAFFRCVVLFFHPSIKATFFIYFFYIFFYLFFDKKTTKLKIKKTLKKIVFYRR